MIIKKLQIAELRSFEQVEFTFQPGMNLLVGVNGVGKTTVLDALRICLSKILPEITASHSNRIDFDDSDIRIGSKSIQISCDFEVNNVEFNLLIKRENKATPTIFTQKPDNLNEGEGYSRVGQKSRIDEEKERQEVVRIRDIETITPSFSILASSSKTAQQQPLAIYYSTRRSLIDDKISAKEKAAGGQAAAFSESLLANRGLRLQLIAQWFRAQQELGKETPIFQQHVEALKTAISQFLPHFQNLRVTGSESKIGFQVDKHGISLRINQLSDGERGVLALVLDLARRLSQANPGLENPVRDGVAIVLIDELDLHLHPKWQRSIVENLIRTFPNCQFIATTHSPQIIPAVEPERVQLLKDNEVIIPDRTLGLDSNWILKFLMETSERPAGSDKAIKDVETLINEGDYEVARKAMINFRQSEGFDLPEWSMLEARIARLKLLKKK